MSISLIAKSIKPSPTLALNEKAAILRDKIMALEKVFSHRIIFGKKPQPI
ncbi:MAG: hypothetical protein ACK4PR_08480 [Gammaproteobacteria bacterium]